ncbi:hypothetical protein BU25DRAFT_69991 [Macroventuria anomochaeta]|uniref:Uncharacterized protein n=1 Tax=Macroventuria anomochaeta TaxID=301207 RepID=A0ACB6RYQ5_9PLEO|nr:uncharacterized protein BU25DRAFT_69991 [Macroventuria anomochaeta]KAF2627156.1 hypothetical protein BU25DRAFT_69991 [Macroventuria anomochaeta]
MRSAVRTHHSSRSVWVVVSVVRCWTPGKYGETMSVSTSRRRREIVMVATHIRHRRTTTQFCTWRVVLLLLKPGRSVVHRDDVAFHCLLCLSDSVYLCDVNSAMDHTLEHIFQLCEQHLYHNAERFISHL